jgi:hypothetical protein
VPGERGGERKRMRWAHQTDAEAAVCVASQLAGGAARVYGCWGHQSVSPSPREQALVGLAHRIVWVDRRIEAVFTFC